MYQHDLCVLCCWVVWGKLYGLSVLRMWKNSCMATCINCLCMWVTLLWHIGWATHTAFKCCAARYCDSCPCRCGFKSRW